MAANTTPAQKKILLEYISKYPSMATNSQTESSGRDHCNKRWETLVHKLNNSGPPTKNIKAWKKTWADYKHRTKQKLAMNKNSLLNKIGGGPFKKKKLTLFEEAVVDLAKIKAAVYGINDIKTFSGDSQSHLPASQPHLSTSQPPTRSSSSSSLSRSLSTESEDSVENLVRTLMSDKNSGTETEITIPAPVPSPVPLAECLDNTHNTPQSSTPRGMMDKLEVFKNSAKSSEDFHNKVVDKLREIRDIKREQVDILKKQAFDSIVLQNRKLFVREEELKARIRTNQLKEYELGLRTQC